MPLERVLGTGQSYYQRRPARPLAEINASSHAYSQYPAARVLGWQLFSPVSLKEKTLNEARLSAIDAITTSLILAESLGALQKEIADAFNVLFPYASVEVEFRSDILAKSYSKPGAGHFPHLFQSLKSGLTIGLPKEPTTADEVNQKMKGIPLFDSRRNLLGIIVLSLGQDINYFPKEIQSLSNKFKRLILNASTLLESKVKTEQLRHQSGLLKVEVMTDSLTGLGNRRCFDKRINEEFERARRYNIPLSLLLIDIDHFKDVNDTYGHQTGDKVLQDLAKLLKKSGRGEVDLIMRYGGEEFALILPNTPREGAYKFAKRLRIAVQEHRFKTAGNGTLSTTISIGVSTLDSHRSSAELIKTADKRLYKAKRTGRNKVV